MDSNNIKSLDTKYSSGRLPPRTNLSSPQKICFDRAALRKPLKLTVGSDTKTHSVGCHHPGSSDTIKRGTLLSPLLDKKTEWLFQDDLQPEESEQVHTISEVQDGNGELGSRSDPTRSIYVYDRFERCVLPCANTSKISKIPQIRSTITLGRRGPLSVQGAAFWDFFGPKDIHKNHDRGDSFPEAERDSSHPLPGRSVTGGRFETRAYTPPRFHNEDPTAVRMDNKPGKVQTKPKYRSCVSRNIIGFDPADVLLTTRESNKTNATCYNVSKKKSLHDKGSHEDTGPYDIFHTKCTVEPKSHQSPSKLDIGRLGQRSPTSKSKDPDSGSDQAIPGVVDRYFQPGKRNIMASLASDKYPDGRKSVRMGSGHSRPSRSRSMAVLNQIPFLELPRTESCSRDFKSKCSKPEGKACKNLFRQHHHGGLSPSSGGYQEPRSPQSFRQDIHLGRNQHPLPLSHPSKGRNESNSGLSQSSDDRPQRVVSKREHLFKSHTKMGTTSNRPFCHQQKYKSSSFLLSASKYSGLPKGCLQPVLERTSNVCLSSYTSHSESNSEDQRRPSKGYTHCSLMAKEELVSVARKDGIGRTCHAGTSKQSSVPGSSLPSRSTGSPALGMDPERRLLISRGLSNKVLDFLQAGFDKGLKRRIP
ncbi:uncharacterized protein [Engystomops pustulosus]|uniref:uncharacterized protein n=1 Tax=Engystomops pustulosus TaxID=76066 RepID=UPI003AFB1BC6